MRFTALACSLLLAFAASASAAPKLRVLTVPGESEGLAVDSGAAFVLRRTQHPTIVRVDLATGRRTTVFRTDGIPSSFAAGGGVLGLTVDLGDDARTTQLVAIPTASPAGGAAVLRQAAHTSECGPFSVDGVTAAGELLVSTISGTCGSASQVVTVSALGPAGERVLSTARRSGDPLVVAVAGPWELELASARSVRLVNVVTGTARTFRTTLPDAHIGVSDLQTDGRFIFDETVLRPRGGSLRRVRVMSPTARTRVLGTVGSPPRLDALFCGGRLVVLRTKDRRTRIVVGGREIGQVPTSAEPSATCDARRVVVEASYFAPAPTRLTVVPLR